MNKRQILLLPQQSSAYAMGRILLVHAGWETKQSKPLGLELGMTIDFVVQSPRLFTEVVPGLLELIEPYGFDKADIGEMFATRRLNSIRERYLETVSELISRGLLESTEEFGTQSEPTSYRLTDGGRKLSQEFESFLSNIIMLISRKLADEWAKEDIKTLLSKIRKAVPDQSLLVQEMLVPFGQLEDTDV